MNHFIAVSRGTGSDLITKFNNKMFLMITLQLDDAV